MEGQTFSWFFVGRFVALFVSLFLVVLNFFLIFASWDFLGLGSLKANGVNVFYQLLICYPLVGEYLLVALVVVCFVALVKGGFRKLKPFREFALLGSLVFGLFFGLFFGLLSGLFFGLLSGLIDISVGCLVGALVDALVGCLAVGLVCGLVLGLAWGLEDEFK